MTAFYNECDPFAAQWLRNLISARHIAPGIVDERPIQEIEAFELSGFTQCHFFAGIGVWSHALRRAGWPDERPIWTGSCPCQPFSNAGTRKGISDERHLWPYWHPLIEQRKPSVVIGEQVASKEGLGWLDLVQTDMEAAGYAFGANDLCAAGFGGAHIRQRLYFVGVGDALPARWSEGRAESGSGSAASTSGGLADTGNKRESGRGIQRPRESDSAGAGAACERPAGLCSTGGVDNASSARCFGPVGGAEGDSRDEAWMRVPSARDGTGGLADDDSGPQGRPGVSERGDELPAGAGSMEAQLRPAHAPLLGRHAVDWLYCRDAKWRPVEPGTFPLADAAPQRVGRLRAYGNALDAETATEFCRTVREICDGL